MTAPIAGYYGKLPVSPEFLRLHGAGPELRELDEWFGEGVQYAKAQAGSGWHTLLAQADIWNFFFMTREKGRAVCGTIFASRDRAGRSFPFLTFLLIDPQDCSPTPWLIPLRCHGFLEQTKQRLQQLRVDLDWDKFRAYAESLDGEIDRDVTLERGFEDYLSRTTIHEFQNQTCAAIGQPKGNCLSHGRPVPKVSDGRSDKRTESGWKVPLVRKPARETYDLPFWLELYARVSGVKNEAIPALLLFWNRAPSKVEPCALISFGCPSPRLARFIVAPDVTDAAWREGMRAIGGRQDRVAGCSPESSTQAADGTGVSLKRYLDSMDWAQA